MSGEEDFEAWAAYREVKRAKIEGGAAGKMGNRSGERALRRGAPLMDSIVKLGNVTGEERCHVAFSLQKKLLRASARTITQHL